MVHCLLGFNENEVCDFVELTHNKSVDVRFIEYMPFTGNKWDLDKFVSYKDMLKMITNVYSEFSPLPNGPNDTSKVNMGQVNKFIIIEIIFFSIFCFIVMIAFSKHITPLNYVYNRLIVKILLKLFFIDKISKSLVEFKFICISMRNS